MTTRLLITLGFLSVFVTALSAQNTHTIQVSNATDLDWTFCLANQSLAKTPSDWLPNDYDSTNQRYDVQAIENAGSDAPLPLLLFVSPSAKPAAFREWADVCRQKGILLASPHAAGNRCPPRQRVRIVMDVLSDLKSKHTIDPDRTYIGGFSGGGRIACMIAFALPEYFSGVLPVCAGGELRSEPWLRQRVADRLSVAQLTGDGDFNRGEVERLHQRELELMNVRCKTWVAKRTGHRIPSSNLFTKAWDWLEADYDRRQNYSEAWPASRMDANTRQKWASLLFDEATTRIADPKTKYSGLMQLKGIRVRWNDLKTASKATKLLSQAERENDQTWQADERHEQLRAMYARASGLDAYASGELSKPYEKQRSSMLKAAIAQWQQFSSYATDAKQISEARTRMKVLQEMLESI